MRTASSLLVLLAGCNEVYGLDPTTRRDAAFFDAGVDALHECPPIGTPPQFSRRFRQVVTQVCTDFVVARTGRALGFCRVAEATFGIAEGELFEPLTAALGFDAPGIKYRFPRLSPDGETAIVAMVDTNDTVTFGVHARGDTSWTLDSQFTVTGAQVSTVITTNRHVLVATPTGLQELVDDGSGFQPRMLHDLATLGVDALSDRLQVTADGLRVLAYGRRVAQPFQFLYADRANDTAPFSAFTPLPDLDFLVDGYMTEDCAHLYFSGIGQVFSTEPN
jgi:hypothetical protein